jgi:hypothetical protein
MQGCPEVNSSGFPVEWDGDGMDGMFINYIATEIGNGWMDGLSWVDWILDLDRIENGW